MKIKDRPEYRSKPRPLTCTADTPVTQAVSRMSEKGYGAIVATDSEGRVAGMMTERDVMTRIVDQGRDPAATKVGDVMSTDIRVATEEDRVVDWLRIMSNERFRRLPIVDEEGRLMAIMTQGDFVSYTWPDLLRQAQDFTTSTVSNNYQVFFITGAVLAYTLILIAVLGIF